MKTNLCPAQQKAFEMLKHESSFGRVLVLFGNTGLGKSMVLHAAHSEFGGAFLNMSDFINAVRDRHPLALEEVFSEMVMTALNDNETVIIDDFHLLNSVVCCNQFYPRVNLLNGPLMTITTYAMETNKKLIFANNQGGPGPIHQRAFYAVIEDFGPTDYEFLCQQYLPSKVASRLDYQRVHRFATKLNGHQLRSACLWLKQDDNLDTERLIEYLRSQRLASNVDLSEVQAVELSDLKGIDDVIQSLEANIVLPLENDELSTELQLKPKRGVLLAGPPGTGKTTIGPTSGCHRGIHRGGSR